MNKTASKPAGYLLQEVNERWARLNIPAQAILELTYRCNLKCAHCYVDTAVTDELTTDEWKRVIDVLKKAGTIDLLMTGGEITVRKDFLEIASYARSTGFFLKLITNCTLVDSEVARNIAQLKPSSINTSLYGATAETHELVTGVPGSFAQTIEGIDLLVKNGLKPRVQTLVMKSNVNELKQIEKLIVKMGAEIRFDMAIAPSKTGAGFPFQVECGIEDIFGSEWRPDRPDDTKTKGQYPCKAGKALCSVSPGGDVYPCNLFPLKLGNLKQVEFDKIWRLEPCAELRYLRSMKHSDLSACNHCDFSVYCQRCTGISYLETGRFDGPSSSACRQAEIRCKLDQATEVEKCQKNLI